MLPVDYGYALEFKHLKDTFTPAVQKKEYRELRNKISNYTQINITTPHREDLKFCP